MKRTFALSISSLNQSIVDYMTAAMAVVPSKIYELTENVEVTFDHMELKIVNVVLTASNTILFNAEVTEEDVIFWEHLENKEFVLQPKDISTDALCLIGDLLAEATGTGIDIDLPKPKDDTEASITWCTVDIIERGREQGRRITEDAAKSILAYMIRKHDCNIGITWDTIDAFTDMHDGGGVTNYIDFEELTEGDYLIYIKDEEKEYNCKITDVSDGSMTVNIIGHDEHTEPIIIEDNEVNEDFYFSKQG